MCLKQRIITLLEHWDKIEPEKHYLVHKGGLKMKEHFQLHVNVT